MALKNIVGGRGFRHNRRLCLSHQAKLDAHSKGSAQTEGLCLMHKLEFVITRWRPLRDCMALKKSHITLGLPWGQKGPRRGPLKGQAAIFDGIMFLMLVSISVALMFAFLSDYGNSQARILRSAHLINYVQGIGKSIYMLDAGALQFTDLNRPGARWSFDNCNLLSRFKSNTVADLLKRDVSDGKFNNKFGNSGVANAPGKLALRCALFELMKPVVGSGFDYLAETLEQERNYAPFPIAPAGTEDGDTEPVLITSLNFDEGEAIYAAGKTGGCDLVSRTLAGKQLFAISTPFRVFDADGRPHDHQLRICMWPSERTS